MTQPPTQHSPTSKKKDSKIWVFLSLLLTFLIMGWAFSLPFRSDALSLGYSGGDADSGDGAEGVLPAQQRDRTRTEAEEFRAAAIALDEEFMRQRQERLRKNEVPGKKQVKQHWHQHVKRVQRQLRQIGNPRRGSMEWQEKQELFKSLDDAPRP